MLMSGKIVTRTKRDNVVTVPVTPRLRLLIEIAAPRLGEEDIRFIDLLNNRRMVQGNHTIEERWNRWKQQAGLPPGLRIHDLRRDAAHRAYEASHDLREVQGLLGHASLQTTLHYLFLKVPQVSSKTIAASLVDTTEAA
jgi:integrase